MYPVFFEIGPLTIFSLWLFIAIGLLIALLVIYKLTKKKSFKTRNSDRNEHAFVSHSTCCFKTCIYN